MKCILAVLALLTASSAFAQIAGSKVYIPPSAANTTVTDGTKVVTTTSPAFNVVIQSEFFKEKLPLTLVADSGSADYTLQWAAIAEEEQDRNAGGGLLRLHGGSKELYTVSASLLGKNNQVVWAGSVDKKDLHGCAVEITRQLKNSLNGKK
ncbi:MAG TPA: hypothetical protein VL913_00680 [Candidatus Micrarchaeaceae archaeon]|nr:hypothetical protein [Candidatus Micrarchaeaceae archaeon]